MKKNAHSAKGFGLAGVFIVIIALVAIGSAGVYVYHNNHKSKTSTVGSTSRTGSSTEKNKGASSKTGTATTAYFTIKEWGVRAPYSGTDLSYSPVSGNSNEVWISSQQLVSTDPHCVISANSGNLGYIGKYLPTDTVPGIPPQPTVQQFLNQNFAASDSAAPAHAKVGSLYYIYWSGEACSTSSLVTQLRSEVDSLVENLQTAPQ